MCTTCFVTQFLVAYFLSNSYINTAIRAGVRNLETCLCTHRFVHSQVTSLVHYQSLDTWVHKRCTFSDNLHLRYIKLCTSCALKCPSTWSVQGLEVSMWCTILCTKVHFLVVHKACYLQVHKACYLQVRKQVSKLSTPVLIAVQTTEKYACINQ